MQQPDLTHRKKKRYLTNINKNVDNFHLTNQNLFVYLLRRNNQPTIINRPMQKENNRSFIHTCPSGAELQGGSMPCVGLVTGSVSLGFNFLYE
jgi:uncharacterized Fe-S cluster protein YjdI